MVSVLDSGASGPGSGPGQGQCIVFLGKTVYSHSASLHTSEKWVPATPCDGLASHPGGAKILLVASCHGNRDKLRPDGPSGSYAETFYLVTNISNFGECCG